MVVISLRVEFKEKEAMERYAKFYGITISELIRELFAKRIEDEEDIISCEKFQKQKENGALETIPSEVFWKDFDIDE